jgi:hypothetical protein
VGSFTGSGGFESKPNLSQGPYVLPFRGSDQLEASSWLNVIDRLIPSAAR